MLILQTEARDHAKEQPQATVAAVENAQNNRGAGHPEDRLESVHGEKIVKGKIDGREQYGERGKKLRFIAAAHFASHPSGQKDLGERAQRGKKTQRAQRVAEKHA